QLLCGVPGGIAGRLAPAARPPGRVRTAMTPFGEKLRAIRAARGLALKDMAAGLQVSPAYLSAMEPGRRGKPSRRFVHRVCQFLGIIWDEAEELQHLADLSHPRVVVDTAGLSVKATLFANLLAARIADMEDE